MPNNKNIQLVEDLKQKIAKSKTVVFADYIGLKADDINQLRQKVRDTDSEVVVAKNTLLKVALEEQKMPKDLTTDLKGPTMAVFSFSDPISAIKVLYEFAKNLELPKIKSAVVEGVYRNAAEVEELKDIPTKEVLLARFLGSLNSPISGLVSTLSGVQRKFLFAISDLAKKKQEGGA